MCDSASKYCGGVGILLFLLLFFVVFGWWVGGLDGVLFLLLLVLRDNKINTQAYI